MGCVHDAEKRFHQNDAVIVRREGVWRKDIDERYSKRNIWAVWSWWAGNARSLAWRFKGIAE